MFYNRGYNDRRYLVQFNNLIEVSNNLSSEVVPSVLTAIVPVISNEVELSKDKISVTNNKVKKHVTLSKDVTYYYYEPYINEC